MPFTLSAIDKNEGLTSLLSSTPAPHYHSFFQNLHLVSGSASAEDGLELEFLDDAGAHIVQAKDDKTGHICGASWWKFTCTTEARDAADGDTISPKYIELSLNACDSRDPEIVGTSPTSMPHVFLYALVSYHDNSDEHMGHHLLYWGLERADLLGLAVWVYATPSQGSFYQSHGFHIVGRKTTETQGREEEAFPRQDICLVMQRSAQVNRIRHRQQYMSSEGFF